MKVIGNPITVGVGASVIAFDSKTTECMLQM
uniref:Uncharacterized protein n=1 Tax=viral metagenome TaxID=1070528 RepID=A0A6C0EI50_9ZZZZ